MKKTFLLKALIFSAIAVIAISCNNKPHFVIEGKIAGASDSSIIYLSKRTMTETTVIDSVKPDKDGSFSIKSVSPEYPDFYLLTLNGQSINLAVDSIETIQLSASAKDFANDYKVEGSESSMYIKDIVFAQNKLKTALDDYRNKQKKGELTTEQFMEELNSAIKEYKDKALSIILKDKSGMAGYFAVFQKVDEYLIFDPNDKADLRAYQAVATRWENSPSPRGEHIRQFTLSALALIRKAQNDENTLSELLKNGEVDNSEYYNVSLPDIRNKETDIASLKGKVVVLDFTSYMGDFSPAHSIELNTIYERYKPQVEIYQVSLDPDEHAWRNAAANLPWICVRDARGGNSLLIQKFNLQTLPATFILNKDGSIVKRIMPNDNIATEIQKIL